MYNETIPGYFDSQRYTITYYNGYLSSITRMQHNFSAPNSDYFKWDIFLDYDDHISSALGTTSPDSLNWTMVHQEEFTYTPDNTTGLTEIYANIVRNFTAGLVRQNEFDLGLPSTLGCIGKLESDSLFYDYNGSTWDGLLQYNYVYDTQGRLSSVVLSELVGTNVFNIRKLDFVYYDFGSLYNIAYSEWSAGHWANPHLMEYYYYQDITFADDPVLPTAQFKVTASPNPFSERTFITFKQSPSPLVRVKVYNLKGELVKELDSSTPALTWDGTDNRGKQTPTGIYLLKADSGTHQTTLKLIRMK